MLSEAEGCLAMFEAVSPGRGARYLQTFLSIRTEMISAERRMLKDQE